ncbi:MAG: alanine--glyoxylate aminotransferase family protein [Acidobacteria bacterium]|nr:alanine--glyoxylate aminotransferase family protein [Acidobacteriota bacterium]
MAPLAPTKRLLLGPGPSDAPPEVLRAMSNPVLGHLDPAFLKIMDETMQALRLVFGTKNEMTLPISGAGSAGMEAAMVNLLEPGDRAVIGVCGHFGARMAEIARRCGAEVETIEPQWGDLVDPGAVKRSLEKKRAKLLGIVHVETSTGVMQPLAEMARLAHANGALFVADTVASLGGIAVDADAAEIDLSYSGSQKCLSAPPGLAPLTITDRAMAVVRGRKSPVRSWYLDLSLLNGYWGAERVYHHTAPVTMVYALREALRLCVEEGLEPRYRRHMDVHTALAAGLPKLGLEFLVPPERRAPVVNAIKVPAGVDAGTVKKRLLEEDGIEIAGGLGPFAGKIWRIGLMGYSARLENVERLLAGMKRILGRT